MLMLNSSTLFHGRYGLFVWPLWPMWLWPIWSAADVVQTQLLMVYSVRAVVV